jgi:hypothetical protein
MKHLYTQIKALNMTAGEAQEDGAIRGILAIACG